MADNFPLKGQRLSVVVVVVVLLIDVYTGNTPDARARGSHDMAITVDRYQHACAGLLLLQKAVKWLNLFWEVSPCGGCFSDGSRKLIVDPK